MIRSPGSLDHCRREEDYRSVTAFFDNWRYNFLGANLLVYKTATSRLRPDSLSATAILAWGLTWNSFNTCCCGSTVSRCARSWIGTNHLAHIQGVRLRQRYNTVLAIKPATALSAALPRGSSDGNGI